MKDFKTPYFLDDFLPSAVRQYLEQHISGDLDEMTDYLINTYDRFKDKNPRLFKSSVDKAYKYVLETQLTASKKSKKSSTPKQPNNSNSSPRLESLKIKDSAINCANPAKQMSGLEIQSNASCRNTNETLVSYLSPAKDLLDFRRSSNGFSQNSSDHMTSYFTPIKGMSRLDMSSNGFSKKKLEKKKFQQNKIKSTEKPAFNHNDFFVIDVDCDDSDQNKTLTSDEIEILDQPTRKVPEKTPVKKKFVAEDSVLEEKAPVKKRRVLEKDTDLDYLALKKDYQEFSQGLRRVTFDQLAGLEPVTKDVLTTLCLLQQPEMRPVTRLVSGPPGCGKTALVSAIAQAAGLPVVQVSVAEFLTGANLCPEKRMTEALLQAFTKVPALVLISQMDRLGRDSGSSGLGSRQADAMTNAMQSALQYMQCCMAGAQLLVVAECTQAELLDQQLMDCFRRHITIKPPTAAQRVQILKCVCSKKKASPDIDYSHLGLKCSGFVAGDFVRLVDQAMEIAAERCSANSLPQSLMDFNVNDYKSTLPEVCLINDDLLQSSKVLRPVLKKEGFPAIPDITWRDVGGLVATRAELRRRMLDPIMDPDLAARYNRTTSGILLWGPPGCGKTLLAKAVANEAGINLLTVNGPSLLSMYQGESERAVRVVFARAASVAPCIIFFDEFDSLCPRRSNSGTESGSKSTIVNMLLTEMNGFMERAGVYVMAATNRPAILDPAVLRPGRFDTLLYVGLPDLPARVAVFNAATKNGTLPGLASDVNLLVIAEQCKHYSGADCRHLVDTACTEAIEELRAWQQTSVSDSPPPAKDSSNEAVKEDDIDSHTSEFSNSIEEISAVTSGMRSALNDRYTAGGAANSTTLLSNGHTTIPDPVLTIGNADAHRPTLITDDGEPVNCVEEVVSQYEDDESNSTRFTCSGLTAEATLLQHSVQPTERKLRSTNPFSEGEYLLYARHFEAALKKVKPSVSEKERLKYEEQERTKKFL